MRGNLFTFLSSHLSPFVSQGQTAREGETGKVGRVQRDGRVALDEDAAGARQKDRGLVRVQGDESAQKGEETAQVGRQAEARQGAGRRRRVERAGPRRPTPQEVQKAQGTRRFI